MVITFFISTSTLVLYLEALKKREVLADIKNLH